MWSGIWYAAIVAKYFTNLQSSETFFSSIPKQKLISFCFVSKIPFGLEKLFLTIYNLKVYLDGLVDMLNNCLLESPQNIILPMDCWTDNFQRHAYITFDRCIFAMTVLNWLSSLWELEHSCTRTHATKNQSRNIKSLGCTRQILLLFPTTGAIWSQHVEFLKLAQSPSLYFQRYFGVGTIYGSFKIFPNTYVS